MVRAGGIRFSCQPDAPFGKRINQMRLTNGRLIAADKQYKVAGWASVGDSATGKAVDEVVRQYLQSGASG
jgi:sulfur-oxidizing protein SoxB